MSMRLKMGFAALLLTAGLASPVLGQSTDTQGATTTQTAPPKHYRAHARALAHEDTEQGHHVYRQHGQPAECPKPSRVASRPGVSAIRRQVRRRK